MIIQSEEGTRFLLRHFAVLGTALGLLTLSPTPTLADPTPTPPCQPSTIQSNFNGTPIPSPDSIWFNVHIQASGIQAGEKTTIHFTRANVTSNAFSVPFPEGVLVFSPTATCATTAFSGNTWTTIVPTSGSDEEFITGLVLPVASLNLPNGVLPGGLNPVSVTGTLTSDQPGVSVAWQWSAAVYMCLPPPPGVYSLLNVKPTHTNACNISNSDHAGTPENPSYKQCVTGGARGGGGSNFTGSWSATGHPEVCVSVSLFTSQTPSGYFTDGPWELGMKFQSTVPGTITAIRYWFCASDTALSHTGNIWDSSGKLLATVTFSSATTTGWQQQSLSAPLPINANTTYIVSVNEGNCYGATPGGLSSQIVNGDLSSVADGQNGVFGNVGAFPTASFNSSNYFRDVVFSPY